jgi:hypothetical protein
MNQYLMDSLVSLPERWPRPLLPKRPNVTPGCILPDLGEQHTTDNAIPDADDVSPGAIRILS